MPHSPSSTIPALAPQPEPATVSRMADVMREMAFSGQTVSVETLALRGYSADTVAKFAPAAIERARTLSTRQIAPRKSGRA